MILSAKAIVYGDDINTDLIIAGKYTKTLNIADLVEHVMEDLDPDLRTKCVNGAFIVAGHNFGCGSSREQAPVALKEAGVVCVAAKSFSRIFYRSAINIGLPIVECDTSFIAEGDMLSYDLNGDSLCNRTRNESRSIVPLPELMVRILDTGGMVKFIRKHGGFQDTAMKRV